MFHKTQDLLNVETFLTPQLQTAVCSILMCLLCIFICSYLLYLMFLLFIDVSFVKFDLFSVIMHFNEP